MNRITETLILTATCLLSLVFTARPACAEQWYEFYEQAMMSYEQGDFAACSSRAEMAFKRNPDSGTYTVRGKVVEYFPHWLICECSSRRNINDLNAKCHCGSKFDDSKFEKCICNCEDDSYSAEVTVQNTWKPNYTGAGPAAKTGGASSSSVYQVPLVINSGDNEKKPAEPMDSVLKIEHGTTSTGASLHAKQDKDWKPAWMSREEFEKTKNSKGKNSPASDQQAAAPPPKLRIEQVHRIETERDSGKDAEYYSAMGRDVHEDLSKSSLDGPDTDSFLDEDQKKDINTLIALGVVVAADRQKRREQSRKEAEAASKSGNSKQPSSVTTSSSKKSPVITVREPGPNDKFSAYPGQQEFFRIAFTVSDDGFVEEVYLNRDLVCKRDCPPTSYCRKDCNDKLIILSHSTYTKGEYKFKITAVDDAKQKTEKEVSIFIEQK